MREIFRRLDAISESIAELKSNTSHENNWKNCEFSWSQIRKICEFLTVAIVFAHHCDTGAITALDKWRPKDLLAEASKLSSHPTPVSIAPDFEKDADGHKQIKPLTKPIAPALISEIYGRASEPIHVGSLERILSGKLPPFDVDQIERWIDGFRRLLTNHILLLPGLKKALVWRAGAETEFFILGSDGADFDPTNLPDLEFKT
jgi:hypothetical protein